MWNEKEYRRLYYQANKEKSREAGRRWIELNPEKARALSRKSAAALLQRRLDKVGSKVCDHCTQEKDASQFARRRLAGGDGLKDTCKPCVQILRGERKRAKTVAEKAATPIPKDKICSDCGEAKLLEDFYKRADCLFGRDSVCKPCKSKQTVEYRRKDPERNEKDRAYRAKNPEKRREAERRYAEKYPEKVKAKKRAGHIRRKKRVKANGGSFKGTELLGLMAKQNGLCVVCEIDVSTDYHVDHIIPVAKGGTNNIENIQILCPACNMAKGSKDFEVFLAEREAA